MLPFRVGDIVRWKHGAPGALYRITKSSRNHTAYSDVVEITNADYPDLVYSVTTTVLTHAAPLTLSLEDLLDEDHVPVR